MRDRSSPSSLFPINQRSEDLLISTGTKSQPPAIALSFPTNSMTLKGRPGQVTDVLASVAREKKVTVELCPAIAKSEVHCIHELAERGHAWPWAVYNFKITAGHVAYAVGAAAGYVVAGRVETQASHG